MTSETTATGRFGTIEERAGRHALRYERRLAHPVERVWAALTEPEQLAGWIGEAELEPAEGGRVRVRFQHRISEEDEKRHGIVRPDEFDPGEDDFDGFEAVVTAVDPPHLLEYESDTFGLLRWELRPDADGCVLTFENVVALPDDAMGPQVLAGWHSFLDLLEAALAGEPVTDWSRWSIDDWAELRDAYRERLGSG